MVMLQRWSVSWRENGHIAEIASLMEAAWSCYRDGKFNGVSMAMLLRWSVSLEGEWSCYRCGQVKDGREWSCYRGYF